MTPKYIYTNKSKNRNLVMEVDPTTRTKLLTNKVKLGWLICYVGDYIHITLCYNCCKYEHKAKDCKGEETCPLCAGKHKLKECTASKN